MEPEAIAKRAKGISEEKVFSAASLLDWQRVTVRWLVLFGEVSGCLRTWDHGTEPSPRAWRWTLIMYKNGD